MSDNPFKDLSPEYVASTAPVVHQPSLAHVAPAILMLIFSSLHLLLLIVLMPFQILQLSEVDWSDADGPFEFVMLAMVIAVPFIVQVAIVAGSYSMLRLRSYRNAITAAILSSVPICSPFCVIGIPFGIWAIIVLANPAVKHRFAS